MGQDALAPRLVGVFPRHGMPRARAARFAGRATLVVATATVEYVPPASEPIPQGQGGGQTCSTKTIR